MERAVDLIDRPAADAAQTAQAVVDQLGQVDHVVVGINAWIQGEPFWKVSEDAWERTLAITTTYFAASSSPTSHAASSTASTADVPARPRRAPQRGTHVTRRDHLRRPRGRAIRPAPHTPRRAHFLGVSARVKQLF